MRRPILLTLLALLAACGGGGGGSSSSGGSGDGPLPRGDRSLSIDLSLPEDGDYVAAFEEARLTDMDQVKLSFDWDELDADMGITTTINAFYPAYDMPIVVFIRPIHITADERPSALQGLAFDDASVVDGFTGLVDDFLSALPDTRVDAIIVGSEIDPYLGPADDAASIARWDAYTAFFQQVATHIHTDHPDVLVGSEVTFDIYDEPAPLAKWNQLCTHADFVGISYYGIVYDDPGFTARDPATAAGDFATMVAGSVAKPIWIPQIGYPSAAALGSNEARQAAWITAAFAAWDQQHDHIAMMNFTWLHDWESAAIETWMADVLGITDPTTTLLDEYLGSLGYRTWSGAGSDKAAWPALKTAAAARGWERSPAGPKPVAQ